MSLNWDVFDSAALTTVVNRSVETIQESIPTVGESLMPLVDVQAREVKVSARDVQAFGVGQYRAPGATPPLYEPGVEISEEVVELAILSEQHRIKDEDYLALQSSDENYRAKAGLSIVERGNILALRNRRLTETLRWDSLTGTAVITYPTGAQVEIDYGIPTGTTLGPAWSDHANSTPIEDIKAWQLQTANALGHYGLVVHLGSEAWEDLLNSESLLGRLTGSDRGLSIVREEDVLALLREGTRFVITDAGYRAEGVGTDRGIDTITPYLDPDHVLVTTEYSIEGERIADMPNGQVIVSTGWDSVDIRQGPQAEVLLHHGSKTHFIRYESARIPRIHHPNAFVYADISS